jgi:hypothetical protein
MFAPVPRRSPSNVGAFRMPGGRWCVISVPYRVGREAGYVPPFIFWSHVPSTKRPSFLNNRSVGAKGDIIIERAEEARPRSEIVWVALYSGSVLLLMLAWAA